MERANLEKQIQKTDKQVDELVVLATNLEKELLAEEDGAEVDISDLLKSVTAIKNNCQSLQNGILKAQDHEKRLSSTLEKQLQLLQLKSNSLQKKMSAKMPQKSLGVPKIIITDALPENRFQESK